MSRPALPPRRSAPPPPPPRRQESPANDSANGDDAEPERPMGIAARIASMKLDQIGRNPLTTPPPVPKPQKAPPLPPREPSPIYDEGEEEENNKYPPLPPRGHRAPVGTSPELLRLLARKPPPPPSKSLAVPPAIPGRRLPPVPIRLPTPPPEPEPESEGFDHTDEGYYSHDAETESDYSCLKCHDFSHVDEHAAQFPRQQVSSLDQLAYDLTSPWASETEKFRSIFTWLHHNISYDTVSFFSGNLKPSTADGTLQSGLAVCDGYAGLFKALADRVGLQAHRVTGHGKGFGYSASGPDAPVPPFQGNHAWNCVLMDGQWHLIDSCWGAGHLEGSTYTARFSPGWFTSTPAEFGERHFPEDASYQLISDEDGGPVPWEDYILAPEGPTIFGQFYEHSFAPQLIQPAVKHLQSSTWVSFHLFKLCEHMSRDETDNYVYFINTQDDNRIPLEVNEEGGWSANVYLPRGGGDISLYFVETFDRSDGKGLAVDAFKKGIGRKAMTFGGLARWTAV